MKRLFLYLAVIISVCFVLPGCSKNTSEPNDQPKENNDPQATNTILVDSLATTETVALFNNLKSISKTKVLFGHQDDTAYGVGWFDESGRSDIKDVCGDYPAVYGWDLGDIHLPTNLDGVNFERMKVLIREAYERGGINTISLHLDNPVTNQNAWDNSSAVGAILPGKSKHASYLQTLALVADFLKDLKTEDGTFIPIVLRPYHEHNHTWSWWGKNSCTVEEYNALWIMTVKYFRDTQQIHHLLYAISPQEISSEAEYLDRYPGDEWVDILGQDYYKLYDINNVRDLGNTLKIITQMAEARGKVAALTETGWDKVPSTIWWTHYLLASIKNNDDAKNIAWALLWRNKSADHHFGPYPEHNSVGNFMIFYNDPLTAFQSDISDMYK